MMLSSYIIAITFIFQQYYFVNSELTDLSGQSLYENEIINNSEDDKPSNNEILIIPTNDPDNPDSNEALPIINIDYNRNAVLLKFGKNFPLQQLGMEKNRRALDNNFMRFGKRQVELYSDQRPVSTNEAGGRSERSGSRGSRGDSFMRLGRSGLMRFGRSDGGGSLMRFGRADGGGSLMRFGRADGTGNLMRFGRADGTGNLMRFGRSDGKSLMRFGRSDNLMRFGRSGKNMMRFGRDSSLMRFGRSDNLMRFGRDNNGNLMRFGRSDNLMRFGRADNLLHNDKNDNNNFMRFGKLDQNFMRFGKRTNDNGNKLNENKTEEHQTTTESDKISNNLENIFKTDGLGSSLSEEDDQQNTESLEYVPEYLAQYE